jgi:hypothetical protein
VRLAHERHKFRLQKSCPQHFNLTIPRGVLDLARGFRKTGVWAEHADGYAAENLSAFEENGVVVFFAAVVAAVS